MTDVAGQAIVVGVDYSTGADDAVRWAAATAQARRGELKIVHARRHSGSYFYDGVLEGAGTDAEAMREDADRIIRGAVELARSQAKDLAITTEVCVESPALTLIELSRDARTLVLGRTGRGGFAGMLVGSTTIAVAGHAHCPVAVVRGRADSTTVAGPVVVGIDGSPTSEQAIARAFDEASARGVPLVALHAWLDVTYDDLYVTSRVLPAWDSIRAEEERLLAQRLAGWQEKYPDVDLRRVLVRDRPRHALLEWSANAQLVVVGSRGRGGFIGMLLGSISQALLQHAQCPVLVVRHDGAG
ncbi:universal stress protein [Amycolatopsis minnesotensis]|uniref:Universal stress protein n=1 Tax=Amycolatopsis minnesotensis TaxID=337894 RepID=A0ABP5CM55_9PSEU